MRKFFVKACALLVGTSLLFNISGTLADRVAPLEDWRIDHQQRLMSLWARQDMIEAVTLGNSHSDAIDYSVLGIEGQSLAYAAADLFEVEKYATVLDEKLPHLKIVFIAISYYSFRWDNAAIEPYRTRRFRYYSTVPVWSPIRGDMSSYLLGKMESFTHTMSEVRSDNWFGVWVNLSGHIESAVATDYDGVVTTSEWGTCPHYTAEQLEPHALRTATRNVSDSNQMAVVHARLEQDAYDALARTIERLQSKGIRVILFTPTYYDEYNEYFMESGWSIVNDMSSMANKLNRTYQVEYYDFSNDREIMINPELFYNSDHLGVCGHRVFTTKLLEAINKNGSLGD